MKSILFSDIDGTLVQNHVISDADIEAIKRFRAEGNIFMLCTGRTPPSTQHFLETHPSLTCDGAVLAGGAGIYRAVGEKPTLELVEQKLIDRQVSWDIISYVYENEPRTTIHWSYENQRISVSDRNMQRAGAVPPTLMTIDEWKQVGKEMLVLVLSNMDDDADDIQRVQQNILQRWGTHIEAHTNKAFLDISTKGADKGSGIIRAAELLDANAVCFGVGDGFNDIPMFETLGKDHSFLISSGETSLQRLVKTSVASVAECIKHIMEK
ncbi:MAG: HAD-IIB family hydrolase [Brevinema sp.]